MTDPQPADVHKFPYDRRPSRQRFKERFEKFQPFPYDRHDGKGFARNDEVDLERMKRHYAHATNGAHGTNGTNGANGHHADLAEIDIRELQPADDE